MDQALPRERRADDRARARRRRQARQVAARASTWSASPCARSSGSTRSGTVASNGAPGLHLADRPGPRVRAALRAAHGRGRQRVHAGGRPVRVVEDGLRAPAGRHRRGPLLGHQPAVGRRLAGLHRHRGVERQHLQDPLRLGRRLPLQVPLHLALDRRRDRLAASAASGSRTSARSCASSSWASSRITTIIYAFEHGVDGFPVGDLKPTGAIFLALVPLLLFNYVGFELQNGAAEEMDDPQKDVPLSVLRSGVIGRAALLDPGLRDPARAAGREGHGHRRLPRRRHRDLHRLRRRPELPARA